MYTRPPGGTLSGMSTKGIHAAARVGHMRLRLADLDRTVSVLGVGVTADSRA